MLWQHLLPQRLLSSMAGKLAHCKHPKVKDAFIKTFIKRFKIDMSEVAEPDLKAYPDFNAFFTRKLKPEARPIAPGESTLASPADGVISQIGSIDGWQMPQAKGFQYDLISLLGGETDAHHDLKFGQFATIYLSPRDYHRVHMPFDGQLVAMTHIPGQLFSVNEASTQKIGHLFTRNERVVFFFETAFGPMAMVLVGAMLVGSVETSWQGVVMPSQSRYEFNHWTYPKDEEQYHFVKGQEVAKFKYGSTVIMVAPKDAIRWQAEPGHIKFGEILGHTNP